MRADRRFAFGHDLPAPRPAPEPRPPESDVTAPLPDVYAAGRPTLPLSEMPARPTLPFQPLPRPALPPPVAAHREEPQRVPRRRTRPALAIAAVALAIYLVALSLALVRRRAGSPTEPPAASTTAPLVVEVPSTPVEPAPAASTRASAPAALPSASAPVSMPRPVRAAPLPRAPRQSLSDVRDPWGAR
jgi:hypothetical protein